MCAQRVCRDEWGIEKWCVGDLGILLTVAVDSFRIGRGEEERKENVLIVCVGERGGHEAFAWIGAAQGVGKRS